MANRIESVVAAAVMAAVMALSGSAWDFGDDFADRTLRLDYVFTADADNRAVSLASMAKLPAWAGRRHNLAALPYEGNGQLTVVDPADGDTLYRTSFSSLYSEWLDTGESADVAKAFEHTVLMPMPLRDVVVELKLFDKSRRPMAAMKHTVHPDDILIRSKGAGPAATAKVLHRGGPSSEAIDVAILAEGYAEADTAMFFSDAAATVDAILNHEPFKRLADRFNFVAVAAVSEESGISVPLRDDWRRTAFCAHFSTFYSDRYMTTSQVFDVNDALASVPYEHIIILANTDVYGGGGIYNSYTITTTHHDAFRPVVVHEFGHSFGGLADEYFNNDDVMADTYVTDVEPWEPNVTTKVDFRGKWENLVGEGKAGLFEGGAYSAKGVWRAADDCRMRTNTAETFCPACTQALVRLIDFYTK